MLIDCLVYISRWFSRRPSGNACDDVAAHLMGPLVGFKHRLESILREEEVECERQRRAVTERRRTLAANVQLADEHREIYLQAGATT